MNFLLSSALLCSPLTPPRPLPFALSPEETERRSFQTMISVGKCRENAWNHQPSKVQWKVIERAETSRNNASGICLILAFNWNWIRTMRDAPACNSTSISIVWIVWRLKDWRVPCFPLFFLVNFSFSFAVVIFDGWTFHHPAVHQQLEKAARVFHQLPRPVPANLNAFPASNFANWWSIKWSFAYPFWINYDGIWRGTNTNFTPPPRPLSRLDWLCAIRRCQMLPKRERWNRIQRVRARISTRNIKADLEFIKEELQKMSLLYGKSHFPCPNFELKESMEAINQRLSRLRKRSRRRRRRGGK